VLLAVGEHLWGNVDVEAVKMASLFAGGLAGTREEMCGALSGGLMILGALYGRSRVGEDEQKARDLAKRLRERFVAEWGTTQCRPIRVQVAGRDDSGPCAPTAERGAALLLELLDEASS